MNAQSEVDMIKAAMLKDALTIHSVQVRDYLQSTLERIAGYEGELRSTHEAEFSARGRLLVMQLKSLLVTARRSGLMRGIMNLEQLEAQICQMEDLVRNTVFAVSNFDNEEECTDAA